MKHRFVPLLVAVLVFGIVAFAQSQADEIPEANPARPTVSNPATLTPVGYLQFETGYLAAWHSPEFSSQSSFNEVVKLTVSRWIELLANTDPFAHSRVNNQGSTEAGSVALGVQAIVHHGEGPRPTFALNYQHEFYGGNAPDLDLGSPNNSLNLMASADVKGFHYDTNSLFNEITQDEIRRGQFGQTLSISHALHGKLGVTGEIWRFSQPFLRSNAVGNLWALNYNARKNLVFDAGFDHGLTHTSTRWEVFAGFTYVLPHRIAHNRQSPTNNRQCPRCPSANFR